MATTSDTRLKQVQGQVERIFTALTAIQRVVKVRFDQQASLPSGKVTAGQYQQSPLGQRHSAGATAGYYPGTTMVILGFWTSEGVRITASSQVAKILSAANRETKRLQQIGNTWRTKNRHLKDPYQSYLEIRKRLWMPPHGQVEAEMHALGQMLNLSRGFAKDNRVGEPFGVTEAEARMTAFLMCNEIEGDVSFYATHSPCARCSGTFAAIASISRRLDDHAVNPNAYTGDSFAELGNTSSANFAWRFDHAYYGRVYPTTDFEALQQAVRYGSLKGFQQAPA